MTNPAKRMIVLSGDMYWKPICGMIVSPDELMPSTWDMSNIAKECYSKRVLKYIT